MCPILDCNIFFYIDEQVKLLKLYYCVVLCIYTSISLFTIIFIELGKDLFSILIFIIPSAIQEKL